MDGDGIDGGVEMRMGMRREGGVAVGLVMEVVVVGVWVEMGMGVEMGVVIWQGVGEGFG
jgi:hypothetical protein